MVIGAGKTAESIATCLGHARPQSVIVANRTLLNGQFLADRLGGVAVSLDDLPAHLVDVDMVVSCTASERPILSRAVIEEAVRIRRHKPLFLVDVAQRGDVDAGVRGVKDVFLAKMTDLHSRMDFGATDDHAFNTQAEAIMQWQWQQFKAWQDALSAHGSADSLHNAAAEQRDRALKKACQLLKAGRTPIEALEFLAQTLTNKFMHAPSASLRAASLRGDVALMQAAERLFQAPENAL
jgi:glutamyl-tRNA reductase